MTDQAITIFQSTDGKVTLEVNLENETVWLSQKQMELLFTKSKKTVSEHIQNVFKEGELNESAVVRKFRTTASDGKTYETNHYNLDVVISVGYRVKSQRGTQFRIWATNVLKQYLVQGYALNQLRLEQHQLRIQDLQKTVRLMADLSQRHPLSSDETSGILSILENYSYALSILDDYDHQRLAVRHTHSGEEAPIHYKEAVQQIQLWKEKEKLGPLFGNEKDDSFKSSLATIYQTFGGQELYPSIEEKAAHLLYFIVKNHSFSDGNKRIAAGLFVWFLLRNRCLFRPNGEKRIADNALVALTLLIAESKPQEKNVIIHVVINLINQKNQ
jgi:prophage maintenance system killer protein